MSNDDSDTNTPPPVRVPSEHSIRLPIDPSWLHQWREDQYNSATAVLHELSAIREKLIAGKYMMDKHEGQIKSLADDLAASDRAIENAHARIAQLERIEELRNKVLQLQEDRQQKEEEREQKSFLNKMIDGAAAQTGIIVVMALGAVGIWILRNYFKGNQ